MAKTEDVVVKILEEFRQQVPEQYPPVITGLPQ
jgi:hypothetical protein